MADSTSSQPKDIAGTKAASKTGAATPTANPPTLLGAAASSGATASVWNNSQIINALWSINEDRNSWAGVQGVGFVKLSTNSDSGVVALTILAAHAKQLQSSVNYRQESDGMIHEIYAW